MCTLGINSAYHEPSACLVKDGEVVAAVEEERFNRKRHGKRPLVNNPHQLPYSSIDYCLEAAGISLEEVDHIGFSFDPIQRLIRNSGVDNELVEGDWGSRSGERQFYNLLRSIPGILGEHYGTDIKDRFHWLPHHICHSASAFYPSPFDEAAVLTIDGIGEFDSVMLAHGKGTNLSIVEELGAYPSSLGFLWTKASRFLSALVGGMGEYGAGKLMALAAYGNPDRFHDTFRSFVRYDEKGSFEVDGNILQFRCDSHEEYENLFGFEARKPREGYTQDHKDFAAALQRITNEVILAWANRLHEKTKADKLCMAGGVALNCTANAYLLEHGPFEDIFIQPCANDGGTAIGAALYLAHNIGDMPRTAMITAYTGPEYSDIDIEPALESRGLVYEKVGNIESTVANLISKGAVIGWFQDRMEFGPRALGNRSILADPRRSDSYERVSQGIKKREWFRPLSPSVLEQDVDEWFTRPKGRVESDKWMLFSYEIKPDRLGIIPAVTHHDKTGRVQVVTEKTNPRFYKLIEEFNKKTGVPILVNTSLNVREPIVCTPQEAINTFLKADIDYLVIGDYIVSKAVNKIDVTIPDIPLKQYFEKLR